MDGVFATSLVFLLQFHLFFVAEAKDLSLRRSQSWRPFESRDSSQSWDYLVFTQQWPPATCIQAEESTNGRPCVLETNFNLWTIHGLWPNAHSSSGLRDPEFCDRFQRFKVSNVSSIHQQLRVKWPSYFSVDPTGFWKHEWDKHGTCATSHPSLNTLYKYFKKGLELHDQYNMYKVLKQAGYLPDKEKTIKATELISKLQQVLGKTPTIKCIRSKQLPRPMLTSVIICFDKDVNITDCTDTKSSCYGDILYWPV